MQILRQYPAARLKVLVLWSPLLSSDNRWAAEEASAYLPDSRAEHFWDLWSYGVKTYSEQLKFPKETLAWDLFIVYKPQVVWEKQPPEPTAWLQNLGLDYGAKYSPALLQSELEKWIR